MGWSQTSVVKSQIETSLGKEMEAGMKNWFPLEKGTNMM